MIDAYRTAAGTPGPAKRWSFEELIPGSKAALVNPGGRRTPDFWRDSGQDIGSFMSPDDVASIIWDRVRTQESSYDEYSVMRNANGSPQIREGVQMT